MGSGESVTYLLEIANEYLWYFGLALLVVAGIYFYFRLRAMQITHMRENARLALTDVGEKEEGTKKLTSLEAFLLGLGARVGIGNIAGVATAIVTGGPGAAIMVGMKRGIFSNEAGLGSIANLAGTADTTHPARQGFVQSFGVIVDTIIVCSFTAFTVLSFGDW